MPWLFPPQYNALDICPICHDSLGTEKGVYKTSCNHIFHNDCLYDLCDRRHDIICPICRTNLSEDGTCDDVFAFKHHDLRSITGRLFDGNQDILTVYNNQNQLQRNGGKRKQSRHKKQKKRKTKKNKFILI